MKRRWQKCISSQLFHSTYIMKGHTDVREEMEIKFVNIIFFLLALQPPFGVVFYSPLAGFSLLAYEVS